MLSFPYIIINHAFTNIQLSFNSMIITVFIKVILFKRVLGPLQFPQESSKLFYFKVLLETSHKKY